MKPTKGLYHIDNSDLYLLCIPKYYGETYFKCRIYLFYKEGTYKDQMIEQDKTYKIRYQDITHWKRYTP